MKFGRLAPVRNSRTAKLGKILAKALAPLGAPPAQSADYYSAVEKAVGGQDGWGMLGNDQWGDCVEADEGHFLMLRTANAGTIVIPTTEQVLALYSAETGFNPDNPATDQGTSETGDCRYMLTNGFLGHRAAATGPIDYTNLPYVQWAIQLFGACKIGFNVQQAQMDQFNAGQDWEYVRGSPIIGSHDVPLIAYYADGSYDCITWGKRQHCAPNFVAPTSNLIDEAHGLVFPDWIRASGTAPPGFDLEQLLTDAWQIDPPPPGDGVEHQHRHHKRWKKRQHAPS